MILILEVPIAPTIEKIAAIGFPMRFFGCFGLWISLWAKGLTAAFADRIGFITAALRCQYP